MTIPSTLESLSPTIGSNVPAEGDGTSMLSTNDGLRAAYGFVRQTVTAGSDIASASTITPPSTGSSFTVTGTTTITAIGSTNSWDGRIVTLRFAGSLTLTHSSSFVLPLSTTVVTVAGDYAIFRQHSSGVWHCISYYRATGAHTNFASLGNGNAHIVVTTAGNVSVAQPSSSTCFSVNGTTALPAFDVNATSGQSAYSRWLINGTVKTTMGVAGTTDDLIAGTVADDTAIATVGNILLSVDEGTTAHWKLDTTGRLTNPANTQPSFRSGVSTARTTTGTFVTYGSSVHDYGSVFNTSTGVFTAPVAGLYLLTAVVYISQATAGKSLGQIYDVTGAAIIDEVGVDIGAGETNTLQITSLVALTASQTVDCRINVGGTLTTSECRAFTAVLVS